VLKIKDKIKLERLNLASSFRKLAVNVLQLALVRLDKHYRFEPKTNTTKSKKQLINNQAKALMQIAVMRWL